MSSSEERVKELAERDWGAAWDELPEEAVDFRRSREPAQVTLRIPELTLQALRVEAARRRIAYHALARSWIVEALDSRAIPSHEATELDLAFESGAQLNLKLDAALLNRLKQAAGRLRVPYHRLARLFIHDALRVSSSRIEPAEGPSLKELMLLLLHARGPRGLPDEAVAGVTRLDKLLFLASRQVPGRAGESFYAYHYGPFSPDMYESEEELEVEGLIQGTEEEQPPERASFERMRGLIERQGQKQDVVKLFRLTEQGRQIAQHLLDRGPAYERAARLAEDVKREYGRLSEDALIERVYREFPEFTSRSKIIDQVKQGPRRKA